MTNSNKPAKPEPDGFAKWPLEEIYTPDVIAAIIGKPSKPEPDYGEDCGIAGCLLEKGHTGEHQDPPLPPQNSTRDELRDYLLKVSPPQWDYKKVLRMAALDAAKRQGELDERLKEVLDEVLPHHMKEWMCSQPECGEHHSIHFPDCARCKLETALLEKEKGL